MKPPFYVIAGIAIAVVGVVGSWFYPQAAPIAFGALILLALKD